MIRLPSQQLESLANCSIFVICDVFAKMYRAHALSSGRICPRGDANQFDILRLETKA
jgi:hypothetical protein